MATNECQSGIESFIIKSVLQMTPSGLLGYSLNSYQQWKSWIVEISIALLFVNCINWTFDSSFSVVSLSIKSKLNIF